MNIDMQQAAEKADAMLDATMGAVVPEIQWTHRATTTGTCDVSRYRAVMTVISEERRGSFLGVTERFWKESGYKITGRNEDREHPAIFAVSREGFTINLVIGDKGQAFFHASTPCARKSEVAEPVVRSNGGPDYSGGPIPYPNVRSDFWSAASPAPPAPPR
ncbi:hypothetical protein ACIBCM_15035 [Streptomyces sp. NPDC051018]|uniref:hypothetical protein n=1 Tax=Streptomyces sp. NPDC051018 TaxID=3365639 RepID=UPI0037A95037